MYLVPTLDALPALANCAVSLADAPPNPIEVLTSYISNIRLAVLIKSNQKKKENKYPGLANILITTSKKNVVITMIVMISNVKSADLSNAITLISSANKA